jgi:nitroreductase
MELHEVMAKRYSVRAYRPDAVDEATLDRVLQAACLAPTACNLQPFRVLALRTAGRQAELGRIYPKPWFIQAPLVVGMVALPGEAWRRRDGRNYADVDATIAMDHLILAATAEGLGTCWVAAFDPIAAREVLGLPDGADPIAFTPLGYPADTLRPRQRRPLAELVYRDRWGS